MEIMTEEKPLILLSFVKTTYDLRKRNEDYLMKRNEDKNENNDTELAENSLI